MKIILIYGFIIVCSSFFPAYLGYQQEHALVGYVFTIMFALCTYIPFIKDHKNEGIIGLILVALFGYIIESIGVLTCFPYGCFGYSNQLGIKIFGIVPLMLGFTRPPLVIGVWSYIKNIVGHGRKMWLLGGAGLVLIDLILDPIAVLMGLRSYPGGGFWFGVPLSNFAGRMLSGTISMMILDYSIRNKYNEKLYIHGLLMTMIFFVGYALWKVILNY